MSSGQVQNGVTLSVEFAGICLYVVDRQQRNVSVLMPVADGRVDEKHEDKTNGIRHVPYLLADLANISPGVPAGLAGDGPQFGVVRRLSREEILFEPEERGGITLQPDPLPLPDLTVYKSVIRLKDDPLAPIGRGERPELNVRTILRGGTLVATTVVESSTRSGPPGQDPDWDKDPADWAGSIKWTRPISGNSLTIRIRNWDTGKETPLTLTVPPDGRQVIELKVAILCDENPLEWKEFKRRFQKEDVDFKWLFRLFEANDGGSILKAIKREKLPYPRLKPRGPRAAGDPGCTGGQFQRP